MANLHESPQNKGQNDELPSSDGGGTIKEKQFICIQMSVMQCIFNMVQVYHLKKILKKVNLLKN